MLSRVILFCSLCFKLAAGEIDPSHHEASLYSQNGEDGVIAYIFQKIGTTSRYCVELGASDGITNSNTYFLLLQGWDSLSLDRSYNVPAYNLHKEFITAENINVLFDKYKVPKDFDLLSIDVDYNTFYLWKAIGDAYRPAVVVVATNATHLPSEDKVVIYHPFYVGDTSVYFGASVLSFYKLGRSKGYSLVYAEKNGCNLFFVRDDIIQSKGLVFKDMNDVEALYCPASHTPIPDPLNRPFVTAEEILR